MARGVGKCSMVFSNSRRHVVNHEIRIDKGETVNVLRTVWRNSSGKRNLEKAHPYHLPIGEIKRNGSGYYTMGFLDECEECHRERSMTNDRLNGDKADDYKR